MAPQPIAVGLISPFPPQIGGIASVSQWLLSHEARLGVHYVPFDLARPVQEEMGGRVRLSSVWRQLQLIRGFLVWLPSSPAINHVMISCSASGLIRDAVYVWLLRMWKRRVVIHVHGSYLDSVHRSRLRTHTLKLIDWLSMDWIVPTPWAAAVFNDRLGISTRCVSNPIRTSMQARGTRHDETTPISLLFVGSVGKRKGVPELIEACAAVRGKAPEFELLLVGKEERRGELGEIKEMVERRALVDCVCFAGALPFEELCDVYSRSKIFVLPSHREVLPMALMEAMGLGLPVIASRVGGIPDIVEDGSEGLLVTPGSASELASAISALLADADLRSRLGEAGRARVSALAGEEQIIRQWRRLYREWTLSLDRARKADG